MPKSNAGAEVRAVYNLKMVNIFVEKDSRDVGSFKILSIFSAGLDC